MFTFRCSCDTFHRFTVPAEQILLRVSDLHVWWSLVFPDETVYQITTDMGWEEKVLHSNQQITLSGRRGIWLHNVELNTAFQQLLSAFGLPLSMPLFLINFVYFSELLTYTKFKCIKKKASLWKPQKKTERKKTKRSFKMSKLLQQKLKIVMDISKKLKKIITTKKI